MTVNLNTAIAGLKLNNPLFNASGPKCTTLSQLEALGESAAGANEVSCGKPQESLRYYKIDKPL
ncbi:MAG TPA: hypothetical protein VJB39_01910 [Patescibacteria group bacterium]|nr:hypothetical protein [Patescibacteria group bacterium]